MTGLLERRPELFWRLPGPSAFLAEVDAALSAHGWLQQVVVAVPRHGAPPAMAARVAQLSTQRRVVRVPLEAASPGSVVGSCLRAVGVPLGDGLPGIGDLLGPALSAVLVVVEAQQASPQQRRELEAVVAAAAAHSHNAPASELPLQVLALVPGEDAASLQEGPRLDVLWWWGRLSSLDTALLLRDTHSRLRPDDPFHAAVTEVAGYDLELAVHLADAWDGDLDRLGMLLDVYAERHPELAKATEPPDVPVRGRPAASQLATWCVGGCDAWEGERMRWHACAVSAQERVRLERLLWRAQARTLLPVLEEQRERVVAWLVRQGHARALRDEAGDPAEIGGVWHYMRHRAGMVTRPQMPLVDWLREARNDVAHLRCVSAARLRAGYDLMETTSL